MDQIKFYESKLAYEMDAWDLHEAMKAGQDVVVLDVRQTPSFNKKHIDGAVSYPHKNITAENLADFNQNTLYVTYCDGLGCNAATNGALKMAKLGLNVKELIGGLSWWSEHGYPTVLEPSPARAAS
ncbi:rhodanese-like domain-containing protein [Pseudoalteromonas xiamenensis]|uniref:rhodanese-like domain-containing protein n=1 Tax=Pseudoalteromonas xiamenensis TaxID=882626 RepID=UPI0027E4C3E3|nr:rhodanese-like domain-containing protein [Pseudoalteromonas xiamenensis]WMN61392.1 rhodanese-like domain-containing protein [Pseudoalteromonas xiamenensis]